MPVTDVSGLDNAVFSRLAGDAVLAPLVPDGVHWDLAPQGSTAFVVITSVPNTDRSNALDGGDGWEQFSYDLKAVINSSSVSKANDAAHRIHELFHHATLDVSAGGYTFMFSERLTPIKYSEDVQDNPAAKWWHRGGQYSLMVCPATS